jgi:hypothetical protein
MTVNLVAQMGQKWCDWRRGRLSRQCRVVLYACKNGIELLVVLRKRDSYLKAFNARGDVYMSKFLLTTLAIVLCDRICYLHHST